MKKKKDRELKPKKGNSRKYLIDAVLILGIVGIIFIFNVMMNRQEEQVAVITTSTGRKSGSIVTASVSKLSGKEQNDSGYKVAMIPYSEFIRLNSLVDEATGEQISPVVLAEEADKLKNMYVSDYISAGTIVRRGMFTKQNVTANPWIENIPLDDKGNPYEIYTMEFNASDINTRLLFPGTVLRIRAVKQVDAEYADEIRQAIEQKNKLGSSGIDNGKTIFESYSTISNSNSSSNYLLNQVPVADITFDNIRIVDMINSSGESIFDIYMALLKLPLAQRVSLLNTSVTESNNEFTNRVKPAKLVFVISKDYATRLSEYEKTSGVSFKYTILATQQDDDLYSQIVDVSDSIYSFTEGYNPISE